MPELSAMKPLRALPRFTPLDSSPEVVRVLDAIRHGPLDEREEFAEFVWFAREYPRIYRHHFEHAEHRLKSIANAYAAFHKEAAELLSSDSEACEFAISRRPRPGRPNTYSIYWDFESFLTAVGAALDVLVRVAGTAYKQETPPNFNRFCRTAPDSELSDLFRHAQTTWVLRMKAYRDCFVHYTSVDTLLAMSLREYSDQWEIRARIPVNPDVREILGFRFSRRAELFRYSVYLWRRMRRLDADIADVLQRAYSAGTYPVRIQRLFFLGRRD